MRARIQLLLLVYERFPINPFDTSQIIVSLLQDGVSNHLTARGVGHGGKNPSLTYLGPASGLEVQTTIVNSSWRIWFGLPLLRQRIGR